MISVRDVAADQLENISYRVAEGEDFFAVVVRED